jgi:hypothetical protein
MTPKTYAKIVRCPECNAYPRDCENCPLCHGLGVITREHRCGFCLMTDALENMVKAPSGATQGFYDHVHGACLDEARAVGAVAQLPPYRFPVSPIAAHAAQEGTQAGCIR